jgi:hypothetical protein
MKAFTAMHRLKSMLSGTYRVPDSSVYNHRYVYYSNSIHTYRVDDMCSTFAEYRTHIL